MTHVQGTTAPKSETHTFFGVLTAVSRMTHMAGTEGNEAILAREPVLTPEGVRLVPTLTGNALRHRLIRAPLARHLVETWGLEGKLDEHRLNFLFHGGAILRSGGGREDLALQRDVYRTMPMLRLLGASLPTQPIPGQMTVSMGILMCRENQERLQHVAPEGWMGDTRLRSASEFVRSWQYTRGAGPETLLSAEVEQASDGGRMIYVGESVVAGARFAVDFHLRHVNPLEVGALFFALRRWAATEGTVGGQSARGHGRAHLALQHPTGVDEMVSAYEEHMRAARSEGVLVLDRIFAPPPKRKSPDARA